MSKARIERKLRELGDELRRLRSELAVADEQLGQLDAEADDARLRALMSETPVAQREHRDAQRHADRMRESRAATAQRIEELEAAQDRLLDQLIENR